MAAGPAATIIELHGQPKGGGLRASCADSLAIAKGDVLCWAADPVARTASGALLTQAGVPFAGIANEEKETNDGAVTIGMWTKGIFGITISGAALKIGSMVQISGSNMVGILGATGISSVSGGAIVGRLLKTVDATSQVVPVAVGIY